MKKQAFDSEEDFSIVFDYVDMSAELSGGLTTMINFRGAYCVRWSRPNGETGIEYEIDGSEYTVDFNEAFDKNPFFSGFIKWDGCMEIDMTHHFCGHSNLFQRVVDLIYSGAVTIFDEEQNNYMLHWDKKCELINLEEDAGE